MGLTTDQGSEYGCQLAKPKQAGRLVVVVVVHTCRYEGRNSFRFIVEMLRTCLSVIDLEKLCFHMQALVLQITKLKIF